MTNYFPEAVRIQKRAEFIHLVQRNMIVTEYVAKFTQLSRYAPNVVADEQIRVEQFQEGLRLSIRAQVAPLMLRTNSEVVARALLPLLLLASDIHSYAQPFLSVSFCHLQLCYYFLGSFTRCYVGALHGYYRLQSFKRC